MKEINPTKGVRVEFKDFKKPDVWIEKHSLIAPSGTYTKDWDWRFRINPRDNIDACDDFGHWYCSTVLDTSFNPNTCLIAAPLIEKIKLGYRYYTQNGTKLDSQGSFYEGWSEAYDEWVPVISMRIQKYLMINIML